MGKAPEVCLYCDGTGEGPGSPCGFCENGKPLDTQEDWDNSWGVFSDPENVFKLMQKISKKKENNSDI